MACHMDAVIKAKDDEIVKLLADNRELSEELRQCQADKEFVWTLWKRLQVSSPDLTHAISLVMQREKEKTEAKDSKILEILHSKDEQIQNLQETVTSLRKELDKVVYMKSSLEDTRSALTAENEEMKRNTDLLRDRLTKIETLNQNEAVGLKITAQELKHEKDELNDKLTKLLIDLQTSRMEAQTLTVENDQLKKKLKRLEDDSQEMSFKCQKLQREREALSEDVIKLRTELTHYKDEQDTARRELNSKEQSRQEITESYQQLKTRCEEQQDIILKLQSLNSDAQKVVKEQEKAYQEELAKGNQLYSDLARKYESLQKSDRKLEKAHNELKAQISAHDKTLRRTEKELKRSLEMATGRRRRNRSLDDLEGHVSSQREQIHHLQRRLEDKYTRGAEKRNHEYLDTSGRDTNYALSENTFSPIVERGGRRNKRNEPRSRSLSPSGRQMALVNRRLQATEEKLESTKRLLELKKEELKQIKIAHDKRLSRLRECQAHYRELKETLQEKDLLSPRKSKSKKKIKRPNVFNLRQEDCDAVWNELAFYKRDNRNLIQEKLSLEEELDNLRVQAAMDKATVQELNMCLKQEKDDLLSKLKRNPSSHRLSSTPKKTTRSQDNVNPAIAATVTSLRQLVKNLERKLENSAEDNKLLKKERAQLLKEVRVLKEENRSLKQDIADSRHMGAKLRRDIVTLKHELDNAEDKKLQAELDAKDIIKEAETARVHSMEERETINALRSENSELRSELADLKDELRDITESLESAEAGLGQRNIRSARTSVPTISAGMAKLTSETALKHQDFLTKSIAGMKDILKADKHDPTLTSEDTEMISDGEESDAPSLGERIVRAAISVPGLREIQQEDDDTLVEDVDVKPKKVKLSARSKSSSRYGGADLISLKQRLASLQKQCSTLMAERQNALKQVNDEKDRNALLESEVKGVQSRLKVAKTSIQKLHREVESISREKEELQRALESVKNSMPEKQKYSDTDYRLLENKMRMANSDANHYSEQVKKSQKEIDEKQETIIGLKEKITRLERDVSMKRQLIEEQRAKIKSMETLVQNDEKATSDFEAQIKQLSEELLHKKNYIDSLKRQVQAVGRDKARYEQSYNETKAELQKISEQVSVEQARKLEAEHLANQLESTVEKRLDTIATKSEQALEKMNSQLLMSEDKNKEYSVCIQILTSQLVDMVSHFRNSIQTHKEKAKEETQKLRESDPSMSRAQSIACSILNMSKADFEELMTPVDSRKRVEEENKKSEDIKADNEWKVKVEELANEQPPFAKSLNRLLWDKIQDAVNLAEEKCRVQFEITAEKT